MNVIIYGSKASIALMQTLSYAYLILYLIHYIKKMIYKDTVTD